MGLRINTNVNSLVAIRSLNRAGRAQQNSLLRLSTGLRINRASDDPSGFVISQRLRAQLSGMGQAMENSQNASNLVNTADAALGEIRTLLNDVRESILASIGADADVVAAEQATVNNALSSIDRIAATTRYGTRSLLNGTADFNITSKDANITEINLQQVQFAGASQLDFTVHVTQAPEQATLSGISGTIASGGPVTVEIRGPLGTETISLASGADAADFRTAVDAVRGDTGVYASGVSLFSDDFGSTAAITITQVGGTGAYTGPAGMDAGQDVEATVNGVLTAGTGRTLNVSSTAVTGRITVDTDVAAGNDLDFTVTESGMTFQLGTGAQPSDRVTVGMQSTYTSSLGSPAVTLHGQTVSGMLSTLRSGQANDMTNNPQNALRIVDAALADVNDLSAHIGALDAYTIQPNINSLEVGFEELSRSLSIIQDLDYAREISEFVRSQIMFEAGIFILGQSNTTPGLVLDLLSASALNS